jgi:hypothetical protein
MRRKVSTIMDESLFRRAKLESARQGRPMSALLEEALERYFSGPKAAEPRHQSVAESWGAMALPADVVREIMEEDNDDSYV